MSYCGNSKCLIVGRTTKCVCECDGRKAIKHHLCILRGTLPLCGSQHEALGCILSCSLFIFTLLSTTSSGKKQPAFHSHIAGLLQAKKIENTDCVKGCAGITQRHTARRWAAQIANRSNPVPCGKSNTVLRGLQA